jgi:hypothetical protein
MVKTKAPQTLLWPFILITCIVLALSSCKQCITCHMVQDGNTVMSSDDYCHKKEDTEEFKKRMESNNALLEYANAKVICDEEE